MKGNDKWRLHSKNENQLQLELLTANQHQDLKQYLAAQFTARLTEPIDWTSRQFKNTFLNVLDRGPAACKPITVRSLPVSTSGNNFRFSLQSVSQNGRHGVIATLTVDRDFESVGGSVSAKLKIRKSNAKQMFNAFNAPGQNGHPAVHRVVAVNKHVIKNVLEELNPKDLPLLIITNLLRKVQITFIRKTIYWKNFPKVIFTILGRDSEGFLETFSKI